MLIFHLHQRRACINLKVMWPRGVFLLLSILLQFIGKILSLYCVEYDLFSYHLLLFSKAMPSRSIHVLQFIARFSIFLWLGLKTHHDYYTAEK